MSCVTEAKHVAQVSMKRSTKEVTTEDGDIMTISCVECPCRYDGWESLCPCVSTT